MCLKLPLDDLWVDNYSELVNMPVDAYTCPLYMTLIHTVDPLSVLPDGMGRTL